MTWAGSAAPNTELPATIQFAPAEAAISMVEGPKPPSTYMNIQNDAIRVTQNTSCSIYKKRKKKKTDCSAL